MPTPIAFNLLPFRTADGTHDRTMSDWFGDIVCVSEFADLHDPGGAANFATGTGNDGPCFEAAFAAAFKTGGVWNGLANAHLNKPVFVPAGQYNTTETLYLEKVVGGHIYGASKQASRIKYALTGAPPGTMTPVLHMNGCSDLCIEKMMIQTTGYSGIYKDINIAILDINWDGDNSGNGCDGNQHNHFQDLQIGGGEIGVRIGTSGSATSGGQGMLFINCNVGADAGGPNDGNVGFYMEGPSSWATVIGGGAPYHDQDGAGIGVYCPPGGGSFFCQGMSNTGNGLDYVMESGKIMYIGQHRSESIDLLRMENGVVTINSATSATGTTNVAEINGGICNIEGNALNDLGQIIGTGGELYLWATNFGTSVTPLSGYSGTVRWNPGNISA